MIEQVTRTLQDLTHRLAPTCRLIVNEEWLEVRPNVSWNRVSAIERIETGLEPFEALTVYLGNDDEGTFLSLDEALTVRIDECEKSMAQYYLAGPPDVRRFLEWVSGLIRQQRGLLAGASH